MNPDTATGQPVLLNLGCGHVTPAGWINVDGSNRSWLASRLPVLDGLLARCRLIPPTEFSRATYYANLSKRFPWGDDSVDGIYMGEILEHFTREEGTRMLRECHRVLKPGGVLRIRVPDNARFWQNYLNEYSATKQAPRTDWNVNHSRWVEMFFRDICVGKPKPFRSMGHFHKWMYDDISLIATLERLFFREVNRMTFHESRLVAIERVEVRDDLIVEGIK